MVTAALTAPARIHPSISYCIRTTIISPLQWLGGFPSMRSPATLGSWKACMIHLRTSTTATSSAGKTAESWSNRAHFKQLDVHPAILNYIQMIGVGIPPRSAKRRARRRRGREMLMDRRQEQAFLKTTNRTQSKTAWLPPPPFACPPQSDDYTEAGQKIGRLPVKVIGSVQSIKDDFPRSSKGLPEVALAGRSNVGKSTLLNALLYGNQPAPEGGPIERKYERGKTPVRSMLPRGVKAVTSPRPGETRQITFYQLSSKIISKQGSAKKMGMLLVDLPGYGYAYASENQTDNWRELMEHYLLDRGKALKRILLLIDARHGMKKGDFEFLESLEKALYQRVATSNPKQKKLELPPIQLVLTKCDLVSQTDLARRVVLTRQQLSDSLRREPSALPVMLVSARAGVGFNNIKDNRARGGVLELQKELAALAPFPTMSDTDTK